MLGVRCRARIGLVAATAIGATTSGLFMVQAPAAEAATCYERRVGVPIDEKGIQCPGDRPGDPAIWKSYTYPSKGFGYYTETMDLGGGRSRVRLTYRHADGRTAISSLDCAPRGCSESYWNGVPFPFGH
jgi:hypothetical protein